ncbi:ferrous iron transporter B [Occallatibacter riparius]|uniref:Ferrous iron transporter B n=1 Tax=Occallatibacter riparius TaxID=1002689 RepID=A0A9J7BRC4_9BACT|nr:ferrous iron transporter B [Occallatibacter riparius]UWZ83621.1 ferrous iron transporter B [Occallatibacter riparius]
MNPCCETPAFEAPKTSAPGQLRTVVLIGPPNAGKSTLFNRLTGLRQKVANYPGVTVEQRMGLMAGVGRDDLTLVDLPGVYSLTPYSEDARVAVDVLKGKMPGTPKPDAVLLVLDSLHLTRQLMLAAPVLSLGLPTLVLLNMSDLMESRGGSIDTLKLARELGAPVAQISATHGTGLDAVPLFLNQCALPRTAQKADQLLTLPVLGNAASTHKWAAQVSRKTDYKAPLSAESSRKLDNILLHRIWGPLLFLVVVIGVFEVVFSIGQPLSDGFGDLLGDIGTWVRPLIPLTWLQSLLLDGVWKGISSVLVFLPQILLLFLFIGVLEDSGYLARAALIADRVMRTVGLNGKAFIPLLSAYACAVPAIMATRTIENRRDRIATILVTPFMTCSARLPVYMLLIAAFVPNRSYLHGFLGLRAMTMLGLYLAGFVAAMTTAHLLKSSILKSSETPFILELPQYRRPTLRSLALRLLDRARIFLRQAGTVILAVTMALWVLAHLPIIHTAQGWTIPELAESLVGRLGHFIEPVIAPLGFNWKIGIGLISSVLAREVMVSTMGTLYGADPGTQALNLQTALHHDMTLGGALALMIFFAFAMQCTSTMAVVRRETNSWKWPALQFSYMLVLAYVSAFVVNHVVTALNL